MTQQLPTQQQQQPKGLQWGCAGAGAWLRDPRGSCGGWNWEKVTKTENKKQEESHRAAEALALRGTGEELARTEVLAVQVRGDLNGAFSFAREQLCAWGVQQQI